MLTISSFWNSSTVTPIASAASLSPLPHSKTRAKLAMTELMTLSSERKPAAMPPSLPAKPPRAFSTAPSLPVALSLATMSNCRLRAIGRSLYS